MNEILAKLNAGGTSDYFNMLGKKSTDMAKKRKPIDMTPSLNRPYCRHKEFKRMPQYSLERVSICFPA